MAIIAQNINQKLGYKQTEVGEIPDDWEVKKLGEIFQFLNTANNSRSDLSENGEIKYIHYGDIHTKWTSFLDCLSNELPLIQKDKVRNVPFLEDGDLVMADVSEDYEGIGVSVEVKNATGKKVVAGLHTFLLRGDKEVLADGFKGYLQYMPTIIDSLRKAATGISVYGISKNNVRNIPICLPDITEQQAIAAALSDVDALITSLDRLIAKKRDIKQATMQQLLTGKTRLSGFSGEWEVKELEEIREKFVNGGTPSTHKSEYWQGNIPWITGADVINQKISDIRRFITTEAVKNSSTNIVERGNLLLVTRTGVGKVAVAPFDVAISQDITGIYVKKEQASIEYLFHYFNYSSETLKSLNQGTSIAGITRETLLSTKVYLPSLSEQQAIATILSDMDAEIVALEQKRDKTRALKQGMMQELLTGKTRLL